ncbi:LytR C-terminal domain-containing protein [Siccirubricoccus deserti]
MAAAPPARPARPEPAAALASGPRVFVHYRGGSPAAAEAASTAAALLRDSGFEVSDLRTVQSVPAQRVVRYFHAEDAGAAARLAGRLGRGWAIQDFRNFEPSPAPQTLEIWLPER